MTKEQLFGSLSPIVTVEFHGAIAFMLTGQWPYVIPERFVQPQIRPLSNDRNAPIRLKLMLVLRGSWMERFLP